LAPVFATAVLAAFAILLWIENNDLRDEADAAQQQKAANQRELEKAHEMFAALTAPDAMQMTLKPAKAEMKSQGRVVYQARTGTVMFVASNLAMPPEKKAYELWLIPMNGHAPMPAGMFKPDASGTAMVSMHMQEAVEAKNFAITLEDEAGSSAPSEPAVMTGQGL
jgi:anti-sigma-K factor RskA